MISYKMQCFESLKKPSEREIVIFYTDILTRKVVLWSFFKSETSEKKPQINFLSENLSIERNFLTKS